MPNSMERRIIEKFFEPRKEFIEETRILFLSKVELKGKSAVVSGSIFIFRPFVKYAAVAFFVIVFLSGGLVIYADSNNVSPANPLYGCKKIGERMRVAFAPKERKPMIDHQLAQRRIEEMRGYKNENNRMMKSLNEEYKDKMDLSLDEMAVLDKEMKELCARLAQTMAQKIEIVKAAEIDDHVSEHFKEHCGQFIVPVP